MYEEIRADIVRISRRAYERGHVAACSGNISVRTLDGDGFVIKASGVSFADICVDDLLFVDWQGEAFECSDMSRSDRRPSIETALHRNLYIRKGDEARAVVHLHSPYTTALSFAADEIPLVVQEAIATLGRAPIIPHLPAGSDALAAAVSETFSQENIKVAVLGEHGPVATGRTLDEAYNYIDMLEHNAQIAATIRMIKASGPRL